MPLAISLCIIYHEFKRLARHFFGGYQMAKGVNQKLKMLYLARIFMEETDDEHGLTMAQLISN